MIDKLLIPKAYVEVLEILKYIPEADYKKVPNEIIENMKINADKEYNYVVTHFENFFEQEMLKETERDWKKRKEKLDAVAASIILQDYLDGAC